MKSRKDKIDIRKYLLHLDDEGWSELIDSRWEKEVKQTLLTRFPQIKAPPPKNYPRADTTPHLSFQSVLLNQDW